MNKTYHLVRTGFVSPACDEYREGDELVPELEANTPGGRHFNCVECHKNLTGGHAHVPAPEES